MNSTQKKFLSSRVQPMYLWMGYTISVILVLSLLHMASVLANQQKPTYAASFVQLAPTDEASVQLLPAIWTSMESDSTLSVAWGDVDNDGDLDLAIGNYLKPVRLHLNNRGKLSESADWTSEENGISRSVAWGDVDSDGDLDLAVGYDESAPNRLYLNEGGELSTTPAWTSEELDSTWSVAWADVDGDGDLDLAAGNWQTENRIYFNNDGMLETGASWDSNERDETRTIAWGDLNGDGHIDLAVGNDKYERTIDQKCIAGHEVECYIGAPNRIYLNIGQTLEITASWTSIDSDSTWGLAWEDVDGDGDFDLAAANDNDTANRLYLNEGGNLPLTASWSTVEMSDTLSLAWGDVDGDGDPDLAVGNRETAPNQVYLNLEGTLTTTATWSSPDHDQAISIAWGDVDRDGDLDLAIGNDFGVPDRLYLNSFSQLSTNASWSSTPSEVVWSTAWGDIDNDGDLDLAVGTASDLSLRIHLNEGGSLSEEPSWSSFETIDGIRSLAWGDVDGDGDLDLALGTDFKRPNKLYFNEGGVLSNDNIWASTEEDATLSVAWGDVDGDGDLDLAVGNWQGTNKLYLNENGLLSTTATWVTQFDYETRSVAWGDADNDGDLDLAVGNWNGPNLLYLNDGNMLSNVPAWSSNELDETTSLAWGDINGDGQLDLIVGNFKRPTRIYLNNGGTLSAGASWSSDESDITWSVALGDADGDGDLDLATGNANSANRLYRNSGGILLKSAVWSSAEVDETWNVAWGDIDGDGDLDLAAGNADGPERLYLNRGNTQLPFQSTGTVQIGQLQPEEDFGTNAYFYSTPLISERGLITIPYKATLPEAQSVRAVDITYSLDGGGQWIPAIGSHVSKPDLASSVPVDGSAREFFGTYLWNVFDSGFYGQSDNVLIRVEIHLSCMNSCKRASIAAQSYPFRVRGSQVYVEAGENESKRAVKDAIVYRMSSESQSLIADPLKDATGHIVRTNRQGYLQGRGKLKVGDRLMAAVPVTTTQTYTLFYTSAKPTLNGLELVTYTVQTLGVQTLTVLPSNPLMIFNLSISLEWDARNDQSYLDRLESDLHRASELLYDWSNGQAALGDIAIYQNREQWDEADIRIHSSNRLRPHATIGGSVPGLMLDMIEKQVNGQTESVTHLYKPGHVEMSALWNRYGEPGENLGEDWARTLTHELGHYLFFLHDNYVGLDANNQILWVEGCPGVMSNPYSDIYSEFHPLMRWEDNCLSTFSQYHLGRHDWATIVSHYPWLIQPAGPIDDETNAGPNLLPLAVTNIQFVEPSALTSSILVPSFTLIKDDGNRYLPSSQARVFLLQAGNLVDLGTTPDDSILARGALPGDHICVYDLGYRLADGTLSSLTACSPVQSSGELIKLSTPQGGWQPDVIVTPNGAQTMTVSVRNVNAENLDLVMQFYSEAIGTPSTHTLIYDAVTKSYSGTLHLPYPTREGYLHIYEVDHMERGVVINFTLGGAPVLTFNNGDVISLPNGITLTNASGQTQEFGPGQILIIRDDGVTISLSDGTTLKMNDGDRLTFNTSGKVFRQNGEVLTFNNGDALIVKDGNTQITIGANVLTFNNGDTLTFNNGDVLTFNNGDVLPLGNNGFLVTGDASVLTFNNGDVLTFNNGDVLTLNNGDALTFNNGDALTFNNGDVLTFNNGDVALIGGSDFTVPGGGNARYFGNGSTPVRSSDGYVTLYGSALSFEKDQFYTLQPSTVIPAPPLWATTVGQGYRVSTTPDAPDLNGMSISMNYIGRTVDDDKEQYLTIYYWDTASSLPIAEQQWVPLNTKVDTEHNISTAKAIGPGIYILMYSFDVPIAGHGWSIISYPVHGSRPITAALASIDSFYDLVFHYDEINPSEFDRWTVFSKVAPVEVSSLHELEFSKSYLLSVTHTSSVTIHFADVSASSLFVPPAMYYGKLLASDNFTPTANLIVEAYINDKLCGQGVTVDRSSEMYYSVIVYGGSVGEESCGSDGDKVQIKVQGQDIEMEVPWQNNGRAIQITPVTILTGQSKHAIYLPFISGP